MGQSSPFANLQNFLLTFTTPHSLLLLSHFTSILKGVLTLVRPPAKENLEGEDDGDGEDESDQDHNQHAGSGTGNHLEM